MRNIYHMIDVVIGTQSQRMDKALLEVFDRVTMHHDKNRFHVKGWKTNSHYLVGRKFILPSQISPAREYGYTSGCYTSLIHSYDGIIADMEKALCHITGDRYDWKETVEGIERRFTINTVNSSINRNLYGEWYSSYFFKYKGFKNGNMHFEFVSEDVWAQFNQRIAKLKGYPLYEAKPQTDYQEKQTGRAKSKEWMQPKKGESKKAEVLFEI